MIVSDHMDEITEQPDWFYRHFRETKNLADEHTAGDVAALLHRGNAVLEREGLDSLAHPLARQRAAHWEARGFGEEDWGLVRKSVGVLPSTSADRQSLLGDIEQSRIDEMNFATMQLTRRLKGIGEYPEGMDARRRWTREFLSVFEDLCSQPLTFYLGMLIASSDSDIPFDLTQTWTLGELFRKLPKPLETLPGRLDASRKLRNASAHMANVSIRTDGRIVIRGKKTCTVWEAQEMTDEFGALSLTVGALSMAATLACSPRDEPDSGQDLDLDDLAPITDLLASWMEWTEIKTTRPGDYFMVEALTDRPIRFATLLDSLDMCRLYGWAKTLVCRVRHNFDDAGSVLIRLPVRQPSGEPPEQEMEYMCRNATIDGDPLIDVYGGQERMAADPRFEWPPDLSPPKMAR